MTGLTQSEVAQKAGWSLRTYIRIEKGESRLTDGKQALLCSIFSCKPEEFGQSLEGEGLTNTFLRSECDALHEKLDLGKGHLEVGVNGVVTFLQNQDAKESFLSIRVSGKDKEQIITVADYMHLSIQDTVRLAMGMLLSTLGEVGNGKKSLLLAQE
ncbi:MAG: helix-turn-helix transcriptional regulator [Bacteroidetes Order II. Incertae sedis bacterium]|nr:helix-turn-helix transcriptional regulator [Bacteroidetes Order II. bacterium]